MFTFTSNTHTGTGVIQNDDNADNNTELQITPGRYQLYHYLSNSVKYIAPAVHVHIQHVRYSVLTITIPTVKHATMPR